MTKAREFESSPQRHLQRHGCRLYEWNATMLPEIDASFTDNFTGDELADDIVMPVTNGKADNFAVPKASPPNERPNAR